MRGIGVSYTYYSGILGTTGKANINLSTVICQQLFVNSYSSPPLIRPPYMRTNCGHIRAVAFGEREKSIDFIVVRTENSGLIRGVASRDSGL